MNRMHEVVLLAVVISWMIAGPAMALDPGPCHIGTSGDDTIKDTIGFNCMTGNAGNDRLHGLGGNDKIDGALVKAQYSSNSGRDHLYGGADRDTFYPGPTRRLGTHSGTVDVIRDFQSGERICSPISFVSQRRVVSSDDTYVVLKKSDGTEHVLALVLNMGDKSATIARCSILD